MAIMIKEDLTSSEGLHIAWNYKGQLSTQESVNSDPISPDSIMTDYEAIHVGPTRNYTWYTSEALKGCVPTWTKPYLRPLIMHHNEKDGKIIGRVHYADYTEVNTLSGTGALLLTANVPDKEGKEGIQDGRLKTVSIGAIVHEANCSICGQNIAEEGQCEHERGVEYDGKICYWMIKKMEAKELSYVIVPSDVYAQHIKIYKPEKGSKAIQEKAFGKGVLNIMEEDNNVNQIVTEGTLINEDGDKTVPPVVPTEPVVDGPKLEAEIVSLKSEKTALEDKIKELDKLLIAANEDKDKAAEDLKSTQVLLSKANEDITKVRADLTAKEEALGKEIFLRESLEDKIIADVASKRNKLVESVIELRTKLNKRPITKEDLEKKTDEFLQESLLDLKEEESIVPGITSVIEGVNDIPPVTNPGIIENNEEKNKANVKEENTASNMSIEESIEFIFSQAMNPTKGF